MLCRNRRDFLKAGAAAGIGSWAAGGAEAAQSANSAQTSG